MNINTGKLKLLIDLACGFVGSNPIQAIKENLLFDATSSHLIIRAEDEDGGIRIETDIDVLAKERFFLAVPSRILQSTFKQLTDTAVDLVADTEKHTLEIHSSNGRYKISCEAGGDFPKFPKLPETMLPVKSEAIIGGLRSTVPVTCTDELRYAMNGVRIAEGKNGPVLFGTDGYTCVRLENPALKNFPVNNTLHRKSANKLLTVLSGKQADVLVGVAEYKMFFDVDGITVYGTTIMDKFPDCTPFFGQASEVITVKMRSAEMLGCLRRASVYTARTNPIITLSIKGQGLNLSGKDLLDFSRNFSEDFSVEHEGDDIDIAFNIQKLAELISLVETEELTLRFSAPGKPVRISNENLRLEGILMPTMINK